MHKTTGIEPAALQPSEVRVEVLTCGIGFTQTLMVEGSYQIKMPKPFSPGGEAVAVVAEVGTAVASGRGLKPGQLVIVNGVPFQEEAVVDQGRVFGPLPPDTDPLNAPPLSSYNTALLALRDRAELQPGESVLVLGAAGAVGITAVELSKRVLGASRVVAACSSEEKIALCKAMGAE